MNEELINKHIAEIYRGMMPEVLPTDEWREAYNRFFDSNGEMREAYDPNINPIPSEILKHL
jgi:hypothetical protein